MLGLVYNQTYFGIVFHMIQPISSEAVLTIIAYHNLWCTWNYTLQHKCVFLMY